MESRKKTSMGCLPRLQQTLPYRLFTRWNPISQLNRNFLRGDPPPPELNAMVNTFLLSEAAILLYAFVLNAEVSNMSLSSMLGVIIGSPIISAFLAFPAGVAVGAIDRRNPPAW